MLSQLTSHIPNSSPLAPPKVSRVGGMQQVRGNFSPGQCGSSAKLIASLLSHDIRHQLSVIYCNAEFLSDGGLTESDRKELFEEVKGAITDATRMLDFILFHFKGNHPTKQAAESLRELIERTVSAVRPHPHGTGVSISIGEFPSISALINQILVSSALYNLLLNACFAAQRAGRPGKVEITVRVDHQFVCILVRDNGVGVPAEIQRNLSKPFVTSSKHNGTGLGITIADYVAREYGGGLQLEGSSPGCTIFALKFAKTMISVGEPV